MCVYTLVESKGVVSSLLYLFFILFVLLLTCKLSQVVSTKHAWVGVMTNSMRAIRRVLYTRA